MQRKLDVDLLRVIATFAVIVTHVCSYNWYGKEVDTFYWQSLNLYSSIFRWCVPFFVMISGIFFLDPEKIIDLKRIYYKYILRLVIILVFWTLFYAFYNSIDFLYNKDFFSYYLQSLSSSSFHLWFIVMIIGLYIIVPFLRLVIERKTLSEYFIILSVIFGFFVPFLQNFAIFSFTKEITESLHLNFVLGYSGYYVLGYYLYKYDLVKKIKISLYYMGVLSFIFTIIASSVFSLMNGKASHLFFDYLSPNVMIMSVSLFVYLKDIFIKRDFSKSQIILISFLSRYSLGIYLIHIFYINVFARFQFTTELFNPIFSVIIISFVVYLVSLFTIYLISKVSMIRKYII